MQLSKEWFVFENANPEGIPEDWQSVSQLFFGKSLNSLQKREIKKLANNCSL